MNLFQSGESELGYHHFCWNLRSLQHLGYGCFAASRTWNEGGNLRTCTLAETPGVHHTKQCHPATKRNRENKRPIFLSFFCCEIFLKLASCITGPCWLLNILCPKFPPSIVLGLSGIIPATCTIRHTKVQPSSLHWCFAQELSAYHAQTCGWHGRPVPIIIFTCYCRYFCMCIVYIHINICIHHYTYIYIYSFPFSIHLSQKIDPSKQPCSFIPRPDLARPWRNPKFVALIHPGNVKTRKSPKESEARLSVGLGFD